MEPARPIPECTLLGIAASSMWRNLIVVAGIFIRLVVRIVDDHLKVPRQHHHALLFDGLHVLIENENDVGVRSHQAFHDTLAEAATSRGFLFMSMWMRMWWGPPAYSWPQKRHGFFR
mmetsp:Transcript_8845/g.29222  ORF Transcript_8845/g.29222 Transcript_8845/m.29222 type:complete len:117 (+) Transcript_8845:369-719(+)